MKSPLRISVTGAAGNIGYALLFRLGSGSCFGPDQPISLQLLEIPPVMKALEGVVMELIDAAFPLVASVDVTDDPVRAFDRASRVFLVGSRPRGNGMDRADLIRANGPIFVEQGKALEKAAADDVRILVVGNPCNTNALIALSSAPGIPPQRFAAMTRLDENRARAQLARRARVAVGEVGRVAIWGNHSDTMYPDVAHATIGGRPARQVLGDDAWIAGEFLEAVSKRGAAIIAARGASSAASAASAAVDHMRTLHLGSVPGEFHSMAVLSDGAYGSPPGVMFSFPVTTSGGDWKLVEGLEHDEQVKRRLAATGAELVAEREAVAELIGSRESRVESRE